MSIFFGDNIRSVPPIAVNQTDAAARTHPDLFTAAEAAKYLHLESAKSLETLRSDFGLIGYPGVSKGFMYWREDLDAAALRIVGRDPLSLKSGQKMRMAR